MVTLAVASIAVFAIYRGYISTTTGFNTQEVLTELNQNLRLSLEIMAREMRMAGYDPSGSSGAGFVTADTSTVRFTKDLNGNGTVTDSGEDITFAVSGTELTKNGTTIADNVDALNLLYLDEDGNVMASPTLADIRSVEVSLVMRASEENYSFTNTETYSNSEGTVIYTGPGDNFHRRMLTVLVRCRNMGL